MDAKSTSWWYRRPGVFIASAAIAAGVSIVTLGPNDRDPVNIDAAKPIPTWSLGYILVTADPWAPDPQTAVPPPPAPAAAPAYEPPATREYVPEYVPPPPPPPELTLRLDNPITSAFVSMKNVPSGSTVGCHMTTVATSGLAASIGARVENDFTLVGTQDTRLPAGSSNGPATGSSFNLTVTCDNGVSTSLDAVY
jgi:hypothetical protein